MELLSNITSLITRGVMFGGGLWLIWGVIILAIALKDKNGPELQRGIWQIAGGALILLAASLFSTLSF